MLRIAERYLQKEWCNFHHIPEKAAIRPKAKAQPAQPKPKVQPDVSRIPCRYEPKGLCTKGDKCPFKHTSRATEIESVVQGISVGTLAGAIAEALQSKSSGSPVAASPAQANSEATTTTQCIITSSKADEQIPFCYWTYCIRHHS